MLGGDELTSPAPPRRSWAAVTGDGSLSGYYLNDIELRLGQFRIPPIELREMLPQQSLMLKVAFEAVQDARWNEAIALRTGVLIGLGLDQNTNNFQLRWWVASRAAEWNRELNLGLAGAELDRWVQELRDAVAPPLTANRTMGSLGGLVASRIARELRIGGPSFSVSCDEASGTQALQIAVGWLRRGELDAALVGAVDISGDFRAVLAANQLSGVSVPGEGATALVLKRLDDALRDGNRVYAIVRDGASAPCRQIDPDDLDGTAEALNLGTAEQAIGRVGAATGLASAVKAAISLYQEILPPPEVDSSVQPGPQFWMRNRADGPRRAVVSVAGLPHARQRLILEALEPSEHPGTYRELERVQPLGARRLALFAIEADDDRGLVDRAGGLLDLAERHIDGPIERLARLWWNLRGPDPGRRIGLAIVAAGVPSLRHALDAIRQTSRESREISPVLPVGAGARIIPPGDPLGSSARVAFVYPGLGNMFAGMGRELGVLWPDVLRQQDARHGRLRDQFRPELFWNAESLPSFEDHRLPILGQVAFGSLATDLVVSLGVRPDAAIGYSMGESSALVSLSAWTDRDEMTRRLVASPLFASELAGPCLAARRSLGTGRERTRGLGRRDRFAIGPGCQSSESWFDAGLYPDPEPFAGDGDRRPATGRSCGRGSTGMLVPRATRRQHGSLRDWRPGGGRIPGIS